MKSSGVINSLVEMASHPWSNSSPRGELEFVLLACLPSRASSVWYMNKPIAQSKKAHEGIYMIINWLQSVVSVEQLYLHVAWHLDCNKLRSMR